MPRTKLSAFSQNERPDKDQNLAEAKARAREIFITMPIARIATVADRVGVSKYYVEKWSREENWLVARAEEGQRLEDQLNTLVEKVGDPKQNAVEILDICNQIVAWTKNHVEGISSPSRNPYWTDAAQIGSCAAILYRVAEIQKKAYQRLGLKCEK